MKFLFIDETEKQKSKTKDNYFFSLCGLIIDKENLFELEDDIRSIKQHHKIENFKILKSANAEKDKRMQCTKEIAECLEKRKVNIMSSVLCSVTLDNLRNLELSRDNTYFNAITFLIERFFCHLKKERKNGIVIHDTISERIDKDLRKMCYDFILDDEHQMIREGNCWNMGSFKNIYPSIFFSKDEQSEILQISDLIALSVNNAIWNNLKDISIPNVLNVENLHKYSDYLKLYWPLFARSPEGKVKGWGIKIWW